MLKKLLFVALILPLTVFSPLASAKSSKPATIQSNTTIDTPAFQSTLNSYLIQANTLARQQNYAEAIVYLDKIIEPYQSYEKANNVKLFSVRSPAEAKLLTETLKSSVQKPIKTVPDNLQSAFYLKGYIYNELGNFAQAGLILDTALGYAPSNARLYNERALVYQGLKDWNNANRYFQLAEKYSRFSEKSEVEDKTRAWRGIGFVATEEHRFDDAIAWYQKCLAIDPNDKQAKGELAYIAKIRQNPPKKDTLPLIIVKP